jgi:hypothetical protein
LTEAVREAGRAGIAGVEEEDVVVAVIVVAGEVVVFAVAADIGGAVCISGQCPVSGKICDG